MVHISRIKFKFKQSSDFLHFTIKRELCSIIRYVFAALFTSNHKPQWRDEEEEEEEEE